MGLNFSYRIDSVPPRIVFVVTEMVSFNAPTDDSLPILEPTERQSTNRPAPNSHFPQRRNHWNMLILSVLAIVLSLLLSSDGGKRVSLGSVPIPPSCISSSLFGVNCPGCGLTRSFILLAHGKWGAAWQMHRFGWLIAFATLVQIPYRTACLAMRRDLLGKLVPRMFGYFLIAVLFGNWLFNQF